MEKIKIQLNNQISEIISSETRYLGFLNKIIDYFESPVKKLEIVPEHSLKEIFGPVHSIRNFSSTILEQFMVNDIAQSFLSLMPFLKVYGDYAMKYTDILFNIENCKLAYPNMRKLILSQETRPEVSQRLQSLLIMPIQRIPRYEIILRECSQILLEIDGSCKSEIDMILSAINLNREYMSKINWNLDFTNSLLDLLEKEFPFVDFTDLKNKISNVSIEYLRAYSGILQIGSLINEQVRQNENQKFIQLLQSKFLNPKDNGILIAPGRKLLKYGVIRKVSNKSSSIQNRFFILTSDQIVYSRIEHSFGTIVRRKKQYACSKSLSSSILKDKNIFGRIRSVLDDIKSRETARQRSTLLHERPVSAIFPSFETKSINGRPNSICSDSSSYDLNVWDDFNLIAISIFPLYKCKLTDLKEQSNQIYNSDNEINSNILSPRTSLNSIYKSSLNSSFATLQSDSNSKICKLFMLSCENEKITLMLENQYEASDWSKAIQDAINIACETRKSLKKDSSILDDSIYHNNDEKSTFNKSGISNSLLGIFSRKRCSNSRQNNENLDNTLTLDEKILDEFEPFSKQSLYENSNIFTLSNIGNSQDVEKQSSCIIS